MNVQRATTQLQDAIVRAGELLDMTDIDDDMGQDDLDAVYEERHHCGVCQTRTVMETVWPAIQIWAAAVAAEHTKPN
jgi:hypothetical protein